MFCSYCGAKNENGAKFCGSCGKPMDDFEPTESSQSVEQSEAASAGISKEKTIVNKIKALPKKVLIGVGCGIIALIVIICIAANAGKTINLNKYMTIETSGYDGYGRATVTIDWEKMEKKYGDKLSFTKEAEKKFGGYLSLMTPMDALEEGIWVSLETDEKLKNGDEVHYTWTIDEDISRYVKCKLKFKNSTYKVSGLKEVSTFDAFEKLNVSFTGISPNGQVVFEYTGEELNDNDFYCDTASELKNGDKITISIDETHVERCAANSGKIPVKLEKTYEVSGLHEYVGAHSDLTEDFLADVKKEAEDTIYSYVAKSYDKACVLSDLKYSGYIMNQMIEGSGYGDSYNNLYVIYSGVVSDTNGTFETTTVYFPVRFSNILKKNNSFEYEENKGIVGNSNLGSWSYSTKGYINPLYCYLAIVESNKDIYTAEVGDGFEKYSGYEVVSKLTDVSTSYKEKAQAEAKTMIENYTVSNYNGGSVATDLTYVGDYFLKSKKETELENANIYVVVFSATVSNSNGYFPTTTVYFPVVYKGVIKLSDGEYVAYEKDGIAGNSNLPDSTYITNGYIDGIEMYSEIITANRDAYEYEVSQELQHFGK